MTKARLSDDTSTSTCTIPDASSQPLLGNQPRTDISDYHTAGSISYRSIPQQKSCPPCSSRTATLSQADPSPFSAPRKVFWSIAIALLWSSFLSSTDMSFVLADNSKIASDFNELKNSGWMVSTFSLANTVANPLIGWFAERFPRKWVLLGSLLTYFLGNLLCLTSINFVMLVAARAVVGIGSAGSSIMTILLWNDFVSLTDVALWQSYTDVVGMLGWMAGGPAGEVLSRMPTWRTVFFVQPLLLLGVIGTVAATSSNSFATPTLARLEQLNGNNKKSAWGDLLQMDLLGAVLVVCGFLAPMYALTEGGDSMSWSHPLIITLLGLTPILWLAFGYWESSFANEPLIRMKLFTNARLSLVLGCTFFMNLAHNAAVFITSYYSQIEWLGSSAWYTFVFNFSMAAGSLTGSYLIRRYVNPTVILIASLTALSVCYGFLWLDVTDPTDPQVWTFFALIAVQGFVAGMPGPCLILLLLFHSTGLERATVIGLFQISAAFGGTVAIAASTALLKILARSAIETQLGNSVSEEIVEKSLQSVDYIRSLPADVQASVLTGFGNAARQSFLLPTLGNIAAIAIAICLGYGHGRYRQEHLKDGETEAIVDVSSENGEN